MKKAVVMCLSFLLVFSFLLSSCASSLAETETEEILTETKEKKEETTGGDELLQKEDPAKDDTFRVLMIGNSFCYYFVEELYGLAKEEGIKAQIYNLYYSGCTLEQHWRWLRQDDTHYELYCTDERGRTSNRSTLPGALEQENWDVVTIQQHFTPSFYNDYEESLSGVTTYLRSILKLIQKTCPLAKLYWQQTWAYEVGFTLKNGTVIDEEFQKTYTDTIRKVSQKVSADFSLPLIPSGEAWELARANPAIGQTLCQSPLKNNGKGDFYHDGDTGGGQYLNACVWFEVLTGKSCLDNTYKPNYDLSQEKIRVLKECAHQAVANLSATDLAK